MLWKCGILATGPPGKFIKDVGGGLLVPYSLPGSPVMKQLMRMVTKGPGQGGRFQSVRFP